MASEEKAPVKLAESHEEHLRASMKRLVEVVPPEEEVRTFRSQCSPAASCRAARSFTRRRIWGQICRVLSSDDSVGHSSVVVVVVVVVSVCVSSLTPVMLRTRHHTRWLAFYSYLYYYYYYYY
jgi:hypothetical protein